VAAAATQSAANPAAQRPAASAQNPSSAAEKPIIVSCQCGKQLRAQPHLAGKTVKCPACARALQIPSSRRPAAASPAAQAVQLEAVPESPLGNNDPWDDLLGDVPAATAPAPSLAPAPAFPTAPARAPEFRRHQATAPNPYAASQMQAPTRGRAARPKREMDGKAAGAIFGGLAMMVGAVIWFVVGWFAGWIFFYPPILFVFGFISFVGGIAQLFRN
jgi:hypothetical protein